MLVHTDPIPTGPYSDVVVLIDVLRTGTVAPLLFDAGVASLTLSPSIKRARVEAAGGALLIGEKDGVPLEGFNHGNSPLELARVALAGKGVVLVSENAPHVLGSVTGARHVLLASLHNAAATAARAAELSEGRVDLVCCGFRGTADLDDLVAAGVIGAAISAAAPGAGASGATSLATSLLRSFPDPLEALWQSLAGGYLKGIGQEQDVAYCARCSVSDSVVSLVEVVDGGDGPLFRFAATGR